MWQLAHSARQGQVFSSTSFQIRKQNVESNYLFLFIIAFNKYFGVALEVMIWSQYDRKHTL